MDFDIFVSQNNQCFKKDVTNSKPDGEETHKKKLFQKPPDHDEPDATIN